MRLIATAPNDRLIPVSIITGFLGSGKTTLVNRLLAHPEAGEWAVLINEFGEVPLDQHFLDRRGGEVVVLPNGCLCCVPGEDLEATMSTLFARRQAGAAPRFARLLIETSGLADPAPLVQLLLANPLLTRCYQLDSVIATVDALGIERQLEMYEESLKQITLADHILLTKTDLAKSAQAARVLEQLRRMNPLARISGVAHGAIAPHDLFASAVTSPQPSDQHHDHGQHHADAMRARGIDTIALTANAPLDWATFDRWFRRLRVESGECLLRAKGILDVAGQDGAVFIHAVNHVMHPPLTGQPWPPPGRQTRLVLIMRGLKRESIEAGWRDLCVERVA